MKGPLAILALSVLALLPGCRSKADKVATPTVATGMPHGSNPHGDGMGMKKESVVVVPAFQNGKYKGIKIAVHDVASGKDSLVVVPLDADFTLPGTGLSIHVDHILTAFGMGDGVITSRSEQMTNPAAQVRVSENGAPVWKGWLFSLYPDAHAFAHEKYTLKLVDFVPAK